MLYMLGDPDEDETNNILTSNKSLNTLSLKFHKLMNTKILRECQRKTREEIPKFRDDLNLHLVLLKQRLLGLSPPVW